MAKFISWWVCFAGAALVMAACSTKDNARHDYARLRNVVISAEDYKRAEKYLSLNIGEELSGVIEHHWLDATDRFWYKASEGKQVSYYIADAKIGTRLRAFAEEDLARIIEDGAGGELNRKSLRVLSVRQVDSEIFIEASYNGQQLRCVLSSRQCSTRNEDSHDRIGELASPDGTWAVFAKDHNIWLRSLVDGTAVPLTEDGEEHFAYGGMAGSSGTVMARRQGVLKPPPVALWSPDSKRIVTHRLDERDVAEMHLLQFVPDNDAASKPVLHSYKFAAPDESSYPKAKLYLLGVGGEKIEIAQPAQEVGLFTPIMDDRVWWSEDGDSLYVAPRELYQKRIELLRVRAADGAANILISEQSETYIDASADGFGAVTARALSTGNIIWYSERDGWGHLYNYDRNGRLINQITRGPWQVRKIVRIDEAAGRVFFTAGGREAERDPYYDHLYSVALDGRDLQLLTPENADHDIALEGAGFISKLAPGSPGASEAAFSPSGDYFIDQYSRPDMPVETVLRDRGGKLIMRLNEPAEKRPEDAIGPRPEPFEAIAADGVTKIYGNIFRPSNFDPSKKYPVVDFMHPGPYSIRSRKRFPQAITDEARAMAELGFITVTIDGRGTPYRSKEFHDYSYGATGPNGAIDDHIAALRLLASQYAYIDLSRVGVYGHSAGGAAAARAILQYPDFFKVAVAASGSHNPRSSVLLVGTTYLGAYSDELYKGSSNAILAENLEGKLLLIHGDLDENVHPAQTMQLADALVRANKGFDMLIVPNAGHSFGAARNYVRRRQWDYFVTHLLGASPPDVNLQ